MGKHLEYYNECMINEYLGHFGLCRAAYSNAIDDHLLNLFTPTETDIINLINEGVLADDIKHGYWACDLPLNHIDRANKFTPLRQTIVLFMAAINDEL